MGQCKETCKSEKKNLACKFFLSVIDCLLISPLFYKECITTKK